MRPARVAAFVVVGLFAAHFIGFLLAPMIHFLLAGVIPDLKSEFTVAEQLGKLYLLLVMIASLCAYRTAADSSSIRVSAAFLALGLLLYLGESNMVTEKVRQYVAAPVILYLMLALYRSRNWLVIILLTIAFGLIAVSSIKDLATDDQPFAYPLREGRSVPEE